MEYGDHFCWPATFYEERKLERDFLQRDTETGQGVIVLNWKKAGLDLQLGMSSLRVWGDTGTSCQGSCGCPVPGGV